MNFIPLIDFMNSLHAKVSLGNHQHLHLRGLHGIPFPDHRPERPVPAELGIGRYQQISQVRGKLNIPLHRMNGIHKTFHFLDSISNQHCLEIIAIPQSVTDPCRNRENIFQHRGILGPVYIIGNRGLYIETLE